MSVIGPDQVRVFVRGFLEGKFAAEGRNDLPELSDGCDLMAFGLIDSLGFVELIAAISEHYKHDVDLEAIDAEEMTLIGPLCAYVAEQVNANSAD